jgi:hypothetical protein
MNTRFPPSRPQVRLGPSVATGTAIMVIAGQSLAGSQALTSPPLRQADNRLDCRKFPAKSGKRCNRQDQLPEGRSNGPQLVCRILPSGAKAKTIRTGLPSWLE